RRIRVWSAACSTGEEPYSLAMLLLEHLDRNAGWEIDILATDHSTRALSWAKEGCWPMVRAPEISEKYLKLFMLKGIRSAEGTMMVGPELRELVRVDHFNLHRGRPLSEPAF